MDANQVSGFGM